MVADTVKNMQAKPSTLVHPRVLVSGAFAPLFALLISWCAAVTGAEPKLKDVTLEWQGSVLSPKRFTTPWSPEYRAGTNLIVLSNATVSAFDPVNRALRWVATSPDNREVQWLAATDNIAYLQSVRESKRETKAEADAKMMRLDLISGKWLADLIIPDANRSDIVLDIGTRENFVVVVSASVSVDERSRDELTGYRVSCFIEPTGKKVWSKLFAAFPEQGPPGAFLLSARRPNAAVARISHISFLGDDILICSGPRQPLLRLKIGNGETLWTVERVWEFERGFMGPSVWSHFISRFGDDEWRGDKKRVNIAATKTFSNRWECGIIGGPVVVNLKPSDSRSGGEAHIFVAVSKASAERDHGAWATYLSDCVVYEFNDDGEPLSMASLPRLVDGSRLKKHGEAIIWNCQNNSVVKLQASGYDQTQIGMGPGGPDAVTRISWFREFDSPEREEWLTTDKAGDPVTFGETHMFRVLSGGYVSADNDKVFNLPLVSIDYSNAIMESMTLRVPLNDSVPLPTTNVRSVGRYHHAYGPYYLAITGLKADGDELAITLGMENWSGVVTFRLRKDK